MKIGKIPNDILREIVFKKVRPIRNDILLRPGIGEDCCAVDFGNDACVLSSDPITGAVNEVGRLAVHVACNDVASCGVEPLGLLVTLLAPKITTKNDLEIIMNQVFETAASINVEVLGGHTEITNAVNSVVLVCTSLGKVLKGKLVSSKGAKAGDKLIITKSAGIEGTAIIAFDREQELSGRLSAAEIERAKSFMDNISVVKEGAIAGAFGVSAMHDATEGGVLGAIWELAEASCVGVKVYSDKIPVERETLEISKIYGIDPLRLISSGSMIIAVSDAEGLIGELQNNGIKASVVGEVTANPERVLISGDSICDLDQPGADELYKVISRG